MMRNFVCFAAAVIAAFSSSALLAQSTTTGGGDLLVRQLEEFGPIGNPTEVNKTWQTAREALKDKAGVLVVPANVWPTLKTGSLQSLIRIPLCPKPHLVFDIMLVKLTAERQGLRYASDTKVVKART